MSYNDDRKGYETKDGGLIRISGDDKIRIDIYQGDERKKGEHTRDTISYDTESGKGRIDQHNEDKTEKSSVDISCFLTTACMKYYNRLFNDNCYELQVLRWFRDNLVSIEDKNYYYCIAPLIVENIEKENYKDLIYDYIYDSIVDYCVEKIEDSDYDEAYKRYEECISSFIDFYSLNNIKEKINIRKKLEKKC